MENAPVRASDAERDTLVTQLRQDMVEGRLSVDEFSDRMEAAYESKTRAELEALRRDLPAPVAQEPARATRKPSRWSIGVMGGSARRGRWRIEGHTTAIAVMGGCHLDLREAELGGPEVTVNALSFMGGVNIFVPDDVEVDVSGFSFMGGRHVRVKAPRTSAGAPVVHIRAYSFMGGLNVVTRPSLRGGQANGPSPAALPGGSAGEIGPPA
jgi:hypothetical protein